MVSVLKRPARSHCPIASTLDILGDKWSLVLVRDMLTGKRRFAQFMASDEGITTNILTDRLARLEEAGLIERRPYGQRQRRFEYHLTPMGISLLPILQEISRWGTEHLAGTEPAPETFMQLRARAR